MSTTYGFADGHGVLIGYAQLCDDAAARTWAADWLDEHADHDCVECWRDERDDNGELPPSFTVSR